MSVGQPRTESVGRVFSLSAMRRCFFAQARQSARYALGPSNVDAAHNPDRARLPDLAPDRRKPDACCAGAVRADRRRWRSEAVTSAGSGYAAGSCSGRGYHRTARLSGTATTTASSTSALSAVASSRVAVGGTNPSTSVMSERPIHRPRM